MLQPLKSKAMIDWRSQRRSQADIQEDFQPVLAGQSLLNKGCLIGILILILILSMSSISYFSGNGGFVIAVGSNVAKGQYGIVAIVVGVCFWIQHQRGIVSGILAAILLSLLIVPVIGMILFVTEPNPSQAIVTTAVISLLYALVMMSSCFVTQLVTLVISRLLVKKNYNILIYTVLTGFSVFISHTYFQSDKFSIDKILPSTLGSQPLVFYFGKSSALLSSFCTAAYSAWSAIHLMKKVDSPNAASHTKQLYSWSKVIASFGGTSFYNLDLSEISFSGSKIANSDFRARKFYRTSLQNIKGLSTARVDRRYLDLDQPKVQALLTTGQSADRNFQGVILRGAYLQDADLQEINFTETNLDGATFKNADLRRAIFIRTIATDVDFSYADLTGCCIKDWSINHSTSFTDIICDYIYRDYLEGRPHDRYPQNRNFEPGEFESILHRVETSYELVVHDRMDPLALSFTLEQFHLDANGLDLELQGLEQRGNNWIVKVGHRQGSSTQQVSREVNQTYEELRSLFEMRYQLALEAKESEISRLNQMMTAAMQRFLKRPTGNVTIEGQGNRVYIAENLENVMESQNITVSGSVGGNLVAGDVSASNLGTMTGNINALIETLQSNPASEIQDLSSWIETIKTAIVTEPELSDEQKEEALDAVATLAEEGTKPTESRVAKLCSLAINALKGVSSSLSNASNLATVLQTGLPLIKLCLGLP